MQRIAIIGAGISGVVIAKELSQKAEVVIFEKSAGVGGRMATHCAHPFYFDHGAQCFTARTGTFQDFLKPFIKSGAVAEWQGTVIDLADDKKALVRPWSEPHLVAMPNMHSLCKALSTSLNICLSCEIAPLGKKTKAAWQLTDKAGRVLGDFQWVISTAPITQTVELFDQYLSQDHPLRSISMQGCYALMLGFNKPWDKKWIAAKVRGNAIKWISINSTKPGRDPQMTCLVAHSSRSWSKAHITDDMSKTQALMLAQLAKVTGIDVEGANYRALHRWYYAIINKVANVKSYINTDFKLAATSDWCQTSRIEETWLHARYLTERICL